MDAAIISVGTELVSGQCRDTNANWLAQQLTARGIAVVRHVVLGDDLAAIRNAISDAAGAVSLVIITGGLGPTADDLTRQAVAEAIGQPLDRHPEAEKQIRSLFARRRRRMDESNLVQARIPRTCEMLANTRGTAPGISCCRGEARLFALPGVPEEMVAMFHSAVVPALPAEAAPGRGGCVRLLCFGMTEAAIGEALVDLMRRGRNPSIGTTASGGIISIRIQAVGGDETETAAALEADAATVRARLGCAIFGVDDDTLQGAVADLLLRAGSTVAVAESCTGGLLAKRLTDIPGSSGYFLCGAVAYANEAKVKMLGVSDATIVASGAVSAVVAEQMAAGCRGSTGADYALSITGIAGPTGAIPPDKPVGLVYVGLADSQGVNVERFLFGEYLARDEIRDLACKTALNLLRLRLIAVQPGG